MMNLKKEDLKKVQRALSSAYKGGGDIEIGDAWERRVMVRVRGLGPLRSRRGVTALFEGVWRFAPVAAAMFLVLGAVLYQRMDILSEYEMARVFLETGLDDSLFQILGAS
jgi:hypothetical protein